MQEARRAGSFRPQLHIGRWEPAEPALPKMELVERISKPFDCVVDEAMSPVLPESERGTRSLVHYQVVLKCPLILEVL